MEKGSSKEEEEIEVEAQSHTEKKQDSTLPRKNQRVPSFPTKSLPGTSPASL